MVDFDYGGELWRAYFENPNEWSYFGKLKFIEDMASFAGNISIVGLWDLDRASVLSIIVHTQYSGATDVRDRLFALKVSFRQRTRILKWITQSQP